jgi:hypothetical protein
MINETYIIGEVEKNDVIKYLRESSILIFDYLTNSNNSNNSNNSIIIFKYLKNLEKTFQFKNQGYFYEIYYNTTNKMNIGKIFENILKLIEEVKEGNIKKKM